MLRGIHETQEWGNRALQIPTQNAKVKHIWGTGNESMTEARDKNKGQGTASNDTFLGQAILLC